MFSPHRRHPPKKGSPGPNRLSDSSTASTDANDSTALSSAKVGGDSGVWSSYFALARRRWGKSHRDIADTLLPTTYASSSNAGSSTNHIHIHNSSSSSRRGVSSSSSFKSSAKNCNSFLMGGHYYPGKDKKRRHLRRRTLWYKLFCSSNGRTLASFLVVAYILVWHALVPLGEWLLQVGTTMSGGPHHPSMIDNPHWLQYDSTLKVADWTEQQKDAVELAAHRAKLQHGSPERTVKRMKLLEKIVPIWYHRNDSPSETTLKQNEQPRSKSNQKVEQQNNPDAKNPATTKVDSSKRTAMDRQKPLNDIAVKSDTATQKTDSYAVGEPLPKDEADGGIGLDHKKTTLEKIGDKPAEIQTTRTRILKISGETLPIRTLKTSNSTSFSKCPSKETIEFSTTLVTQTSLNRLWILNETCTRWSDPIVAVVFVPDGETMKAESASFSCSHIQILQYMANEEESKPQNYPVNRLRNVGLDTVTTSHVLVMDVDFVPSNGLSEMIRTSLKLRHEKDADEEDDHALIVPAFERLPPSPCETGAECASYLQQNSSFIPRSFGELQECAEKEECIVFQSNVNWEGHSSTMSKRWLQRKWYEDEEKTVMMPIPCFHTARYEPYMVLRWCPSSTPRDQIVPAAPYYDERFHGYGKNKIQLVSHLRKKGYRFAVLPEGFIVHTPHPESSIKETWNNKEGSDLHASMDKLYSKYLAELDTKYKEIHDKTVKLCRRANSQ